MKISTQKCQNLIVVNATFATNQKDFNLHLSEHDQVTTFKCEKCGFETNTNLRLDVHMADIHKKNNKRENSISPSSSPWRKRRK